jgi:ribosomal protein S18 acetylase RimI-like enzyme
MVGSVIRLRPAGPEDIAFIMATERIPGFDKLVGRWSEETHRAALASDGHAYLLAIDAAGERAAFAIVRDLDDAHGNVCLKRIAVTAPGRGIGSSFVGELVRWAFTQTAAHRLWLDVMAHNARARQVYASHGFVPEGVMRGAYLGDDGGRIDLVLMSLLRPDWQAQAGAG